MPRTLEVQELALNLEHAGFCRIAPSHPLYSKQPRRRRARGRGIGSPCPICHETNRTLIVFAELHSEKTQHYACCSCCANCEEL